MVLRSFFACTILMLAGLNAEAAVIQLLATGVPTGTTSSGQIGGALTAKIDGQDAVLYCNDIMNQASFGQVWEANLTLISPESDLSRTRYGSLAGYQLATWLALQFEANPDDLGDIQDSIWSLFNPQVIQPATDYWVRAAATNYRSVASGVFAVVTNTGPVRPTGQIQEFLVHVEPQLEAILMPTATPEPGTILLIGAGLIAIGVAGRRRMKRTS